jgi:hypothetical protein
MRLYYMTSTRWGEAILKERRLKLSRFYESNDPFELMLIDSRPRDTRAFVKMLADNFNKNIGMIYFGANWASPVMWAHYADKHAGVCLGFDVEDTLLTRVEYTDKKIVVPFGAHLPQFGLSQELLTTILSTKATDWNYEREYRVMGGLKTRDPKSELYYTDFGPQIQLREVVIGHRCNWTPLSTSTLIGKVDASIRICKARPAFGEFEMVEQKQVRPVIVRLKKPRS